MLSIRPRFSIAALMGFVFVFGVGLAAFRYPSKLWASFLFSIALGAMVVASLGAVFHRGLPQKFWAGYAICGWLYLLMNFGPWFASASFSLSLHDSLPRPDLPSRRRCRADGDGRCTETCLWSRRRLWRRLHRRIVWPDWTEIDGAAADSCASTTSPSIDPCRSR